MPATLQISYRNMQSSGSVERQVRERFTQLEKIYDRLISCRVVIEKAPEEGETFHVHVEMAVPGREIVVRRDPGDNRAHSDAHLAIRRAFDAARRQLEDHLRRMDNRPKSRGPATG
jgi:ribosome-associated translation inhibitor RaiA